MCTRSQLGGGSMLMGRPTSYCGILLLLLTLLQQ